VARQALLLLLALTTAGCAAKAVPPVAPAPPDLTQADALVEAGCYRCLTEAFRQYDGALAAPVPAPGARGGAFATALLLAIREKELGLEAAPWLDRATALATPDERRYVDLALRVPWTGAGGATDFEPPVRFGQTALADWLAGPATAAHPVLDQYIIALLMCETGRRTIDAETARMLDLSRPLVRYRVGLCGVDRRQHLEAVVAADPRFVEAWFFIGRYEMALGVSPVGGGGASRRWLTRALPPLVAAHEGLPEAPIVTIALAGLMRSRTELARALALYDDALAFRPTQGDALLGRLVTLSYLTRRDEAIAAATRLIELGRWHVGPAYYWRSWNHYHAGRLAAAAADIASARGLAVSDDVLTLSGMIAYDQKRPADARADLTRALQMNEGQCYARWYLGLLNVDEQTWTAAADTFALAGACFQDAAESTRAEIDQLPEDLPADTRAAQVASINDTVATSLLQAGRSFFNAAQASMRIDDRAAALAYARSATRYADMKERADALIGALEKAR
jgi:tetratricopeptide (TPR) repeat protein